MQRKMLLVPAAILTFGLFAGCNMLGDLITEKLPSDPTPVTTPPVLTPIAIPVVLPTPVPTPKPTPTPIPPPEGGPTPSPDPVPPPTSSGCGLAPQSPAHSCNYGSPQFAADIEWAIDQVISTKPQFFDMTDQRGAKSPRVLNDQGYTNNLVKALGQKGYCAVYDGEEIALKDSQSFNEQYDILTASGYVRRGAGAYRSTCNPAWF
jgi:hypothetical protein